MTTIENVLKFMKERIRATKRPWVPWGELEKNAGEIVGPVRRPEDHLWSIIMSPHVYSLSEKEPKSKSPRIYELKLGQAYVYYPAKMIELYVESEEL